MRELLTLWGLRLRAGWRKMIVVPLLCAAVGHLVAAEERLGRAGTERVLYDQLLVWFTRAPAPSAHVALLLIDDAALATVNPDQFGRWPWHRSLWARVVEALDAAGASAIVFDLVFEESTGDLSGEEALAQAIAAARAPVYVGLGLEPPGPGRRPAPVQAVNLLPSQKPRAVPPEDLPAVGPGGGEDDFAAFEAAVSPPAFDGARLARVLSLPIHADPPLRVFCGSKITSLADCPRERIASPIPPLRALWAVSSGFGLVHAEEDADGKLRRTGFAYRDAHNAYATLPLAVAADLLGSRAVGLERGRLRVGERTFAVDAQGLALVDFGGRFSERFEAMSLGRLVQELALAPAREEQRLAEVRRVFGGKVALIGGSAIGTADQKATPFETLTSGAVKQAAVLDNLLGEGFIVPAPRWVAPALALLLALVLFALVSLARSWVVELSWPFVVPAVVLLPAGVLLALGQVYVPVLGALVSGSLACIFAVALNHLFASRDRERVKNRLAPFLDRKIVERVVESPDAPRLGQGAYKEVTAFFSDIRGFSSFSEAYRDRPETLMKILNEYLTRVSRVLLDHGAVLDNYIGDAVVCLFGTPHTDPRHAERACLAALEVQREVSRLRAEFRERGYPDVYTRIGLNSAELFVGNFGSEQLFRYTAMGDGMNLASRLEGANKAYGSAVMIGPRTHELAKGAVVCRELDQVRVAGKQEPVRVYEVVCRAGELVEAQRQVLALYAKGLSLYRQGQFQDAAEIFEQALGVDPEDGPSKALRERSLQYAAAPPEGFDGVTSLEK